MGKQPPKKPKNGFTTPSFKYKYLGEYSTNKQTEFKNQGGGNNPYMRVREDNNGTISPTTSKPTVKLLMKNNRSLTRQNDRLKKLIYNQINRLEWIRVSTDDPFIKSVVKAMIKECNDQITR
tara:strand:- start:152 stop:517 length:366 start_codon:yes stop_codon:yes gene_type:complete